MVKRFASAALLLCGCTAAPSFKDGTVTSLGAMMPYDGQLYGIQLISYLNGCIVRAPTDTAYQVERTHSATNSWCWGMLDSVEASSTKVKIIRQENEEDADVQN